MTEWRDVPGYEGMYQVSSDGRVRSLPRMCAASRRARAYQIRGKELRPSSEGRRYKMVVLYRDSVKSYVSVHRLVALAFVPNPEGKPEVNHINSDTFDNRAENLEWVTASENALHGYRRGNRKPITGERNGFAKLTRRQVAEIRERYTRGGVTQYELADQYGISQTHVSNIITGSRWGHLPKVGAVGDVKRALRASGWGVFV